MCGEPFFPAVVSMYSAYVACAIRSLLLPWPYIYIDFLLCSIRHRVFADARQRHSYPHSLLILFVPYYTLFLDKVSIYRLSIMRLVIVHVFSFDYVTVSRVI